MKSLRIIITLLTIGLSGCGTVVYKQDIAEGVEKSTILVYRLYASPTAWSLNFEIDGKKVASMAQKSKVEFIAAAGIRNISINWPALAGGVSVNGDYEILPNKNHYFLIDGDFTIQGLQYTNKIRLSQLTKQQWDSLKSTELNETLEQ